MRLLTTAFLLIPFAALAGSFDRPIPQSQSATAEFWFAAAAIAFCLALYGVHWLVARR